MSFLFTLDEEEHTAVPLRDGKGVALELDGAPLALHLDPHGDGAYTLHVDGATEPVYIASAGDTSFIHLRGQTFEIERIDPIAELRAARATQGGQRLMAPMPGAVVEVRAGIGDHVAPGDTLLVIESMKLQTAIVAQAPGRVAALPFEVGASFDKGSLLAQIDGLDEESA